jgi:hypothetical protein
VKKEEEEAFGTARKLKFEASISEGILTFKCEKREKKVSREAMGGRKEKESKRICCFMLAFFCPGLAHPQLNYFSLFSPFDNLTSKHGSEDKNRIFFSLSRLVFAASLKED